MRRRSSKYSGYQNVQYSRSKPVDTDGIVSTSLNTNSPRKEISKPINCQGEVPSLRGHSRNTEESKNPSNKLTTKTKLLSSSDSSSNEGEKSRTKKNKMLSSDSKGESILPKQ